MNTQFEKWWYEEGKYKTMAQKDACHIAWEAGIRSVYQESDPDDDFNEPLGKACQLDNPDCESCS